MKTDLKPFSVGNATFGDGRLTVIAGPCVIESYDHASMMARECLDRDVVRVETRFGAVRIKVSRRNGDILNVSPEFDDCVRVAASAGQPVKDVQAAAMKAYMDREQR